MVFDNITEVRNIMDLTEKSGLKMIEWTDQCSTRNDSILFRCKKYPKCHAKITFACNERTLQLSRLQLKHSHGPDWYPECAFSQDIWYTLTHPKIQSRINHAMCDDLQLVYIQVEEEAIIEGVSVRALNFAIFKEFVYKYHCVTKRQKRICQKFKRLPINATNQIDVDAR